MVFSRRVGSHGPQLFPAEDAGSPAFHLLEIVAAPHIPHKDQTFQRLHVCAGGDHIDGNGNTGVVIVGKLADQILRFVRFAGDFLAKLVTLPEYLPDDLNNVLRVAVILGEDQRLGDDAPTGENLRQIVLEALNYRQNLRFVDNAAIKL